MGAGGGHAGNYAGAVHGTESTQDEEESHFHNDEHPVGAGQGGESAESDNGVHQPGHGDQRKAPSGDRGVAADCCGDPLFAFWSAQVQQSDHGERTHPDGHGDEVEEHRGDGKFVVVGSGGVAHEGKQGEGNEPNTEESQCDAGAWTHEEGGGHGRRDEGDGKVRLARGDLGEVDHPLFAEGGVCEGVPTVLAPWKRSRAVALSVHTTAPHPAMVMVVVYRSGVGAPGRVRPVCPAPGMTNTARVSAPRTTAILSSDARVAPPTDQRTSGPGSSRARGA